MTRPSSRNRRVGEKSRWSRLWPRGSRRRRDERPTARPKGRARRARKPVQPAPTPATAVQPSPPSRGFLLVWALAVALATLSFIFHLHVRFDIIQTGYALSRAQADQRQLRLEQRELRLELATLKSPGRIEQLARENLGMSRPDHDRIIRLGAGRSRLALRRR